MMMRFALALFVFAVLLSLTASFVTITNPSKLKNSVNDGYGKKLSLSPSDIVSDIANLPGIIVYPTVFAVCFRIGAAIAVIGNPRLPNAGAGSRSNGHIVGSKVVRLPELGSRVRLFYPISKTDTNITTLSSNGNDNGNVKYCTDGRATSDGMASLVGFKQLGLSFLLAHLAEAPSGCYDLEETDTMMMKESVIDVCEPDAPLLVYSHGYGGNMDMATYFLRSMAQRGIVVAALEHTDGTASSTVQPDGSRLDFDSSLCSLKDGLDKRAQEISEAASFIPFLLPGDSSKKRIFLGGHSYGAPSVLLASQRQRSWENSPKIAGLLLHDPALSMGRGLLNLPPKIPTISYVSDEYNRAGVACGDATYHVQGAFHGNFVDAPLWAPLWVMRPLSLVIPACGPADPDVVHSELADSARAFCFGLLGRGESAKRESRSVSIFEEVGGQSLFERVG